MYSFYIYDAEMNRIGQLQNQESVQWVEYYREPGEVKVCAEPTEANIALLADGHRIHCPETDTIARICQVDYTTGAAARQMVVRAVCTAQLLGERVMMGTESITNVEEGLYRIYQNNRRGLPLEVAAGKGFAETTDTAVAWFSVLEAFTTLCEVSGLGFKVVFDPIAKTETLQVYKGNERCDPQSTDYNGYLGTDNGVLRNVQVTSGSPNYRNVAVVAGEDISGSRTVVTVALAQDITGEARRELYVDARDIRREAQIATDTGVRDAYGNPIYSYEKVTYNETQYAELLRRRGYEKLAEHNRDFAIDCEVVQENLHYGEDYRLGDRVAVKVPEYGIAATAVVAAAKCVYEVGGRTVGVTLDSFAFTTEEEGGEK